MKTTHKNSKIDNIDIELLSKLARNGATLEEIADIFDMSVKTFSLHMRANENISKTIKRGRLDSDSNVIEKLYHRALGYNLNEKTKELKIVGYDLKEIEYKVGRLKKFKTVKIPKYELMVTKETTRHIPADVTAQIFWLKNRRPKDWRDKVELPQGIPELPPEFEHMTPKELDSYIKQLEVELKKGNKEISIEVDS